MHETTFEYLSPTDDQKVRMAQARNGFAVLAQLLNDLVPDGPDKTYVLRKLRSCGMWANVAITRHQDGSPRA